MDTVDCVEEHEREAARRRLEILRGIQQAFTSWPAASSAVWEAVDCQAAHDALRGEVGLPEVAAHYVLDLPQGRTTRQARAAVAAEIDELVRVLQDE
jgi:DNA gyrase/topoisomerase IV subunit A